ncbi:MAG: NF038120 family PEP-CTERM protein [Duganella sp.]
MNFKQGKLNTLAAAALGALALMSAAPAMADVINFESVGPGIYGGGETFTDAGYTLSVIDSPAGAAGFAGAVLDGTDPNACDVAACPTGNSSFYYAGLNDGSLKIQRADNTQFRISGLDYGFLAPVGNLDPFSYGQLTVVGTKSDGGILSFAYDFPVLSQGASPFVSLSLLNDFGSATLSSLTIGSCLFDGNGGCFSVLSGAENLGQFALDNLQVSTVPEPETYAMLGLGLGLVGWMSRRRSKADQAAAAVAVTTA